MELELILTKLWPYEQNYGLMAFCHLRQFFALLGMDFV